MTASPDRFAAVFPFYLSKINITFFDLAALFTLGTIVAKSFSSVFLKLFVVVMAENMATHACIFCPKSHSRLLQLQSRLPLPSTSRFLGSRLIAVPMFTGRVSPVLDNCTQLRLLKPGSNQAADDNTVQVRGSSIFERVAEFKKLRIGLIICGAVSEAFYNLLRQADIDLVCGITGDVAEVITAFRNGTLEQGRFRMPGFQ